MENKIFSTLLEVNPFSGVVYGLILALLGYVAWYFKGRLEKSQEQVEKLIAKNHEISSLLSEKLIDLKVYDENIHSKIIDLLTRIINRLEK